MKRKPKPGSEEIGIAPRNGWIADYPVTPDIVAELRTAVTAAADSNKIAMSRGEAAQRLEQVIAGANLPLRSASTERDAAAPAQPETYPEPAVINNYYYNDGPPVVTYYAPPPDFYYLYSWVPAPFWWASFWFPGYFILNDFHRNVVVGHHVRFVSNHFNDFRTHRVFRVDPVARFNGRTFAGIGIANRRGSIATGIPRSDRRIFNGSRTRMPAAAGRISGGRSHGPGPAPAVRTQGGPVRGGRTGPAPAGRIQSSPVHGGRTGSAPPGRIQSGPVHGGGTGPSLRGGGMGGGGMERR